MTLPMPWDDEDDDTWRGDLHFEDWPENLAGPEYWLYRKEADDEEDDDGSSTGRG